MVSTFILQMQKNHIPPAFLFHFFRLSPAHGQDHPEGKDPVLRLEGTQSPIMLGDGADAAAAVAVSLPLGTRQTVPQNHFPRVGIFDFDEQLM